MGSHSVLGYWTYSRELHINRLQLEAAFRALRSFAHFLRGKVVLLYTDNMMVACSANKGDGGGVAGPHHSVSGQKKCYSGTGIRGFLSQPDSSWEN